MSYYDGTAPRNTEITPIILVPAFKLVTGSQCVKGLPAELHSATADSTDGYKYWVKPYADTDGASGCLGLFTETLAALSDMGSSTRDAGRGGYHRDVSLMPFGTADMWYLTGANTTVGMKLAPHPSGCRQWHTGMAVLGICYTPGIVENSGWVKCLIHAEKAEVDYI